jgi:hypothetical protein
MQSQFFSPILLRFHAWAEVQVPQRVKERDQEEHEQDEGNQTKEHFSPAGVFETLSFKCDNFLMSLTKVSRGEGFINALKA